MGNRFYQFMGQAFGLNTAPRVFLEVMKVIKRLARLLNVVADLQVQTDAFTNR